MELEETVSRKPSLKFYGTISDNVMWKSSKDLRLCVVPVGD